jgi:phosphatidate phosphatase APP1
MWEGARVPVIDAHAEPTALHRAAHLEDTLHEIIERRVRQRGWHQIFVPYAGYGAAGWVRVMARVVLSRRDLRSPQGLTAVRGWRNFATLPVKDAVVTLDAGGRVHEVRTDRGGYIDVVVEADLEPGWQQVRLAGNAMTTAQAPVRIVDPAVRFGIVSDIDDTVMVTAIPRPLLAAWNTFVLDEYARAPVPGMAVLYERLVRAHPGSPVFYLSTGAWNVAPTLTRFLSRHLYPAGPLLLTDWGPTADRWFRSGRAHKRASLRRLAREFPHLTWLLVGDDGQHDQEIYAEFAAAHPDRVAAVAIRHLSPTQAVLARGLPVPPDYSRGTGPGGQKWLSAPDGAGLSRLLAEIGLL